MQDSMTDSFDLGHALHVTQEVAARHAEEVDRAIETILPISIRKELDEAKEERAAIQEESQAAKNRTASSLDFPTWVMSGIAGDFARIYGEHLEPPDHFFYMSYLTILGLYLSDRLFLNSQRKPPPRLYTILLGESGDTRKSTAMEETEQH